MFTAVYVVQCTTSVISAYITQFQNHPSRRGHNYLLCIAKLLQCLVSRIELCVFLSLRAWASGWDKDSSRGSMFILWDAYLLQIQSLSLPLLLPRMTRDSLSFKDELDIMKFICKDFWTKVFRRQVDNLRTNHQVKKNKQTKAKQD